MIRTHHSGRSLAGDRSAASRPSLMTIILVLMAFGLGVGPYIAMFTLQEGNRSDSIGIDSLHSRSFASPSNLLRRISGNHLSSASSSTTSARSDFDRMKAEYDKLVKAEIAIAEAKQGGAKSTATSIDRVLREVEAERRRNGYPSLQEHATTNNKSNTRTPVQIIPIPKQDQILSTSRLSSLLQEGIATSKRLTEASTLGEDGVVWIVDLSQLTCDDLVNEADETMKRRMKEHRTAIQSGRSSPFGHPPASLTGTTAGATAFSSRLTSALQWKIYIIDFSDYGYVAEDDVYYGIDDLALDCIKPLSDLVGRRNVYFASREHVLGRQIQPIANGRDEEKPFGPLGEVIDYQKMHLIHFMMGKVRRIDFSYRTILEQCLEDEYKSVNLAKATESAIDLSSLPRPYDVAHFWKVGNDDNHTSIIRDAVNDVVRSLGTNNQGDIAMHSSVAVTSIRTYADHFGAGFGSFKSINVTCPLARMMLQYKILVVAQKDNYEGHYRLMDALLSGALVLTDPMTKLPLFLEDKVSVVVYHSPAELRRLLLYYLQKEHEVERLEIGRRGRDIALRHHSPAAWVERIVLGNWNSTLGEYR